MSAVKPRTYAGESGAERVARRREALIDAALELAAADGWRAVRIEAVCARAGLNKRYFYESFAGVDALIGAVMEQLAAELIEVTVAALDPSLPEDEFVRRGIAALVENLTDDERRARVLFGATAPGEAAAAHRSAAIRRIVQMVADQGRSHHDIGRADPAIDIAAELLVGGTSQAVLDWLEEPRGLSREEFIVELAALWQIVSDGAAARVRHRLLVQNPPA